jgi:hypothetical protein
VSIDWRNVGGKSYVTSIKDQGNCGSCVSFGTAATMESAMRIARQLPVNGSRAGAEQDLSESHLFYCGTSNACGVGWWPTAALTFATNTGVVSLATYPYTAGNQACSPPNQWGTIVTKVGGSHAINTVADMKTWLATKGPLIACFTVYQDFFSYAGGVYTHHTGGLAGGHCVCCIGYDDANNAWICKNSWGTNWGESGFFRIAYGQCGIDSTMWAVDSLAQNFTPVSRAAGPLAAFGTGSSRDPRVYYVDTGTHVDEWAWYGGAWHQRDLTSVTGPSPLPNGTSALAVTGAGGSLDPRVYYKDPSNNVVELSWWSGAWHYRAVGPEAHAPAAAPGASLAAMSYGGSRDPRVYYSDPAGATIELAWVSGWHWRNLTADSKAPTGVAGGLVAAMGTGGSLDPRVYGFLPGGHVSELSWWGGAWHYRDLTADTGAGAAASNSGIAAMGTGSSLDPRVYYADPGGHVHELSWWSGAWHHRDLTGELGAPAAASGSALAAMGAGSSSDPRVYYLDGAGHVHELSWWSGAWHHRDLTGELGSIPAKPGSSLKAMGTGGASDPRVYFLDANSDGSDIRELSWWSGAWHDRDLFDVRT